MQAPARIGRPRRMPRRPRSPRRSPRRSGRTRRSASVIAVDTTRKYRTVATIVPTIEMMRPVIAGHFAPLRNSATIDSTNAIGSSTHAMTSAPGMHAKTNPIAATTSAMMPSTCGFGFDGSSPSVITAAPGAAARSTAGSAGSAGRAGSVERRLGAVRLRRLGRAGSVERRLGAVLRRDRRHGCERVACVDRWHDLGRCRIRRSGRRVLGPRVAVPVSEGAGSGTVVVPACRGPTRVAHALDAGRGRCAVAGGRRPRSGYTERMPRLRAGGAYGSRHPCRTQASGSSPVGSPEGFLCQDLRYFGTSVLRYFGTSVLRYRILTRIDTYRAAMCER